MSRTLREQSIERELALLKQAVSAMARGTPDSFAIEGPRSDLSSGRGVRVRMGLLSNGNYGVEIFDVDGTRTEVSVTGGATP